MPKDLHELPKVRDSLSFLYLEHCLIDQRMQAIEAIDAENGRTLIPVAVLTTLMLGPGTNISHAAVKTLAANGCLVVWCGVAKREYDTMPMAKGKPGGDVDYSTRPIHRVSLEITCVWS